ncbi:GNAT family N-acetyltransferase [Streptomyces sp. NPDC096310]|uniref:GNAT family N-acetyltransferase n=1 Tax=Streptomyces sp. NPDC096310 TaxID=3366082 RepID=UPI003814BEF2
MTTRDDRIRPATAADVPGVKAVTDAAYLGYVERIGRPPAPMDADHGADVAAGRVFVVGDPPVGVLVLVERPGHLLLESVAVHPDARGQGLGRRLLDFTEQHARALGLPEVRLYTHALMRENRERYARHGYEIVARRTDGPYDRIHFRKSLLTPPRRHREVVDVHLVLRRGDEVLLARRAGTGYADGLLNCPSGHVESGEDVRTAVIREAAEEIGLALTPGDLRVALVMQHRGPGGAPRIGWFFEAAYGAGGEPYNREPEKCSGLSWHPLSGLPGDLVAYCHAGLDAYRAGERFVLHWHEDDDPIAHNPDADRSVVLPATHGEGGQPSSRTWRTSDAPIS